MKDSSQRLVCFCADEAVVCGLWAAVYSVLQNTRAPERLVIGILTDTDLRVPEKLRKFGIKIEVVPFDYEKTPVTVLKNGNPKRADLDTPMVYARFFISRYFPEWDECVYLDTDVIVKSDILDFPQFLDSRFAVGAVKIEEGLSFANKTAYELSHPFVAHIDPTSPCFNNGVMWMNLKKWREERTYDEKILPWIERQRAGYGVFRGQTQALVNLALYGEICEIDPRWNVRGLGWEETLSQDLLDSAFILHWTGLKKPWLENGLHQERWAKYDLKGKAGGFVVASPTEEVERAFSLSDYTLVVIASHSVFPFLRQFVSLLLRNRIQYHSLVVGDSGLLPQERAYLSRKLGAKLEVIPLEYQNTDASIQTQSQEYRKIISQRIDLLRRLFQRDSVKRVAQLDADTGIVSNDFGLLQPGADLVLSIRKVGPDGHASGKAQNDYPNLGVVFWNNPTKCLPFLDAWEATMSEVTPSEGQFEQNFFLHAMAKPAFRNLNVQKIHCRFYNCYEPEWINPKTSILHYKSTRELRASRWATTLRSARLNWPLLKIWGSIQVHNRVGLFLWKYTTWVIRTAYGLRRAISGMGYEQV